VSLEGEGGERKKTDRLGVLVIVENAILELEPAGPPVLDVITLLGKPPLFHGVL